jgi:hypothetical protein
VSAPYAVVVSLQKSGTNLVARMMTDVFGYHCVGHGMRDSFEEIQERLRAKAGSERRGSSLFSDPALMLDVLTDYPPRTCLFLHGLEVGSHLLQWSATKQPPIIFNHRDPRDSLLSLVNYLLQRANDPYSPFARNTIYADILESMPSASDQLDFAIEQMGEHVEKFSRNGWLLFHPAVATVSFEELVGSAGGGSEAAQLATVRRVAEHLGAEADLPDLRLFDPSGRTFYRGQVGAWREEFSVAQTAAFARRHGDVLRTYGYPES